VIALPELEIGLAERLAQLAKSLAQVELPAEIEIAPEPADAPGTTDWLRGAARRSRPEGLEIRAPNELAAPQGAPPDRTRMVKSGSLPADSLASAGLRPGGSAPAPQRRSGMSLVGSLEDLGLTDISKS
jgi:hypothetical protein